MLITIYFDAPAKVTPAVHKAFALLGGLDVDNPQTNYRDLVGFNVKAPRALSNADVLDVAKTLAEHFGVEAASVHDISDFPQVALAVSRTADAIAAKFGVDTPSECTQEFDPKSATTDDLLFGLLHWSFEGNNIANMSSRD